MKFFSFASLVFSILFAASIAFAQEQIKVISLTITKSNRAAPIKFDLKNDVELEGRYSIGFFKPTISPTGKKLTDFKSVEYVLFDSRE